MVSIIVYNFVPYSCVGQVLRTISRNETYQDEFFRIRLDNANVNYSYFLDNNDKLIRSGAFTAKTGSILITGTFDKGLKVGTWKLSIKNSNSDLNTETIQFVDGIATGTFEKKTMKNQEVISYERFNLKSNIALGPYAYKDQFVTINGFFDSRGYVHGTWLETPSRLFSRNVVTRVYDHGVYLACNIRDVDTKEKLQTWNNEINIYCSKHKLPAYVRVDTSDMIDANDHDAGDIRDIPVASIARVKDISIASVKRRGIVLVDEYKYHKEFFNIASKTGICNMLATKDWSFVMWENLDHYPSQFEEHPERYGLTTPVVTKGPLNSSRNANVAWFHYILEYTAFGKKLLDFQNTIFRRKQLLGTCDCLGFSDKKSAGALNSELRTEDYEDTEGTGDNFQLSGEDVFKYCFSKTSRPRFFVSDSVQGFVDTRYLDYIVKFRDVDTINYDFYNSCLVKIDSMKHWVAPLYFELSERLGNMSFNRRILNGKLDSLNKCYRIKKSVLPIKDDLVRSFYYYEYMPALSRYESMVLVDIFVNKYLRKDLDHSVASFSWLFIDALDRGLYDNELTSIVSQYYDSKDSYMEQVIRKGMYTHNRFRRQ